MGDIITQLGHLLVQTIPTVVFVFALMLVLEGLFFGPLTRVLKQREEATSGALSRAREQSRAAEAKAREYEACFQAARQEVYRLREDKRRTALSEREARLRRAREESEGLIKGAQAELSRQVEAAKQDLIGESWAIADVITASVLRNAKRSGFEGSPES
jgi:F-type H+-transporting ATPase subunit b